MNRCLRCFLLALLAFACGSICRAQNYTSIVVFGDSLSDTGNFAHLANASYGVVYPGPSFNYAMGRFTDSTATSPAAQAYSGVWVEQLAAQFAANPTVKNNLDGGSNYACGDATTQDGYTTATLVAGATLTIPNMGQQIANYMATGSTPVPAPSTSVLYVVFGGANDLYADSSSTGVTAAAQREATLVQRLIALGATDFLIPNLPLLGNSPEYNSNPTALNAASAQFRTLLAADLQAVVAAAFGKTIRIFQPDLYTQSASLQSNPMTYALSNVTAAAQGVSGIDPDTYLYWDDVHPTTTGHHFITAAAENLLAPLAVPTVTLTASPANVAASQSTTLTAVVTRSGSTAKPSGLVTFYNGTGASASAIGMGTLNAGGSLSVSFTPSAASSSITAVYAGDSADANASSTPQLVTIGTPVTTSTSLTASTLMPNLGASVTFTATVAPSAGVATGSVNFLDGSTVLGTVALSGSGLASFPTSSLAAGSHSISATYVPSGSFSASSSAPLAITVVSPSVTLAFSPTSLTVAHGSTGTVTVTVTPVGGATGTVTLSCGSLPAHASCMFSPASITLSGTQAQTSTLTLGTSNVSALQVPFMPFRQGSDAARYALAFLPFAGLALFGLRRKTRKGVTLFGAILLLAVTGALSGCGSSSFSTTTAPGTYSVAITATVSGTTNATTQATLSVIVQ